LVTSSATGRGRAELADALFERVPLAAAAELAPDERQLAEHITFRPAAARGFQVARTGPHAFRVAGQGIERLLERFDHDNEEAMAHVEGRLRRIGVLRALEQAGFEPGDEIEIGGRAFELDPTA
jgi:GTP-binding protein